MAGRGIIDVPQRTYAVFYSRLSNSTVENKAFALKFRVLSIESHLSVLSLEVWRVPPPFFFARGWDSADPNLVHRHRNQCSFLTGASRRGRTLRLRSGQAASAPTEKPGEV